MVGESLEVEMMKNVIVFGALLAAALGVWPVRPALAESFTLGNLLVTFKDSLYEIDRSGAIVQEIPVPPNSGGPFEQLRDLIVDEHGRVHVFNGTESPALSTYDPATEAWSSTSVDGWNARPNIFYGGLILDGQTVLASDMSPLSSTTDPGGYVAFDVSAEPMGYRPPFPFLRLELVDLAATPGHGFCGLQPGSRLYCFSTQTFDFLGAIRLDDAVRSVTITEDGTILGPVTATGGRIHRFSPDGRLEFESAGILSGLGDIDAWPDGTVTLGSRGGAVVLTDPSLTSFEILWPFGESPLPPSQTFVAMVTAEAAAPRALPIPAGGRGGLIILVGTLALAGVVALRGTRL